MHKLLRILKHRWLDEGDVRRLLGADLVPRVQAHVAASERTHTGEVRVSIEAGLPLSYLWRGATARERAIALFGKLRVWDTEHNNGVLIYLLLAERRIEIVADRGISRRVPAHAWEDISQELAAALRAGDCLRGLLQAVDRVGALLTQHWPADRSQPNPNELPDAPDLR